VKECHRWDELANQTQRGVDIELQTALAHDTQNVGEPRAFSVIGNNCESRDRHLYAINPAHSCVVRVSEVGEPRGAFAQRKLERGDGRQGRADAKRLKRLTCRRVCHNDAFAETVAEQRRLGPLAGKGHNVHGAQLDRPRCSFSFEVRTTVFSSRSATDGPSSAHEFAWAASC
jgi:hypothetical protein